MKTKDSKSILTATICLVTICLVVTLCVAGTRYVFAERIAEQEWQQKQAVMAELITASSYEEISLADGEVTYEAKNGSEVSGYLFETAAYGYGSDVSVMTAIYQSEVLGVAVLDASNETPGLGQNVTNQSFLEQFNQLSTRPVVTKTGNGTAGEIVAVTGATKTSNAVVAAVNEALDLSELIP
ncbi:FMN-binding protein [Enterococcus sp. LJL120]